MRNQIPKYDKFDVENDTAASDFLMDSVDKDLKLIISQKVQEGQPFPEFWMTLVTTVRSASIERFESIKSSIKARTALNYPGQNVVSLACDYRREAMELMNAGQYDHNLTLHMLKTFIKAGGDGLDAENYRYLLRDTFGKLNNALVAVGYMAKVDADDYMVKNSLTYLEICEVAERNYTAARDQGEWPPARNPHDSKAPPKVFGSAAMAKAQGMTLIHSSANGRTDSVASKNAERGACHNCGEKGHWSRECPKPKQSKGKGKSQSSSKGATSWKTTAPGAGQSESKTHDGKQFRWCGKCARWTTTHDTASHTGESKKKVAFDPSASLVWDPHVFSAVVESSWLWNMVAPYLPTLIVGYFAASIEPFIVEFFSAHGNTILDFTFSSLLFLIRLIVVHHQAIPSVVLWISLYAAIAYIGWFNRQPEMERGRRRAHRFWWKCAKVEKKRERVRDRSPGSIRNHGFHRTYPRHLREQGQFHPRPNYTERSPASIMVDQRLWREHFAKHGCAFPKPYRKQGSCQGRPATRVGLQFDPASMGLAPGQMQAAKRVIELHVAQVSKLEPKSAMQAILQAPKWLIGALPKEATFPVIWDSGADRKSTRLNSSHRNTSRMPSSA